MDEISSEEKLHAETLEEYFLEQAATGEEMLFELYEDNN